jgi:hypothetical protein
MQRVSRLTRSRRSGSLLAAHIVISPLGGKRKPCIPPACVANWLTFSCRTGFQKNPIYQQDTELLSTFAAGYVIYAWQRCRHRRTNRSATFAITGRRHVALVALPAPLLGLTAERSSKHRVMAEAARLAGVVYAERGALNIAETQSELVQLIAVHAVEGRSAPPPFENGDKSRPYPPDSLADMRLCVRRPFGELNRRWHVVIGKVCHGILQFLWPFRRGTNMGWLACLEKRINMDASFKFSEQWNM